MTLFFYGANTFALRQQVAKMIGEYTRRTGSDMGLERLDGAIIKPRELMASLQAAPFLATSRLVVVEGLSGNKGKIPWETLLGDVPTSTVAVFVESQVDKRTSAFKTLGGADKVVEFSPLSIVELTRWANAEIKRLGGAAERPAVNELVALVGDDQWRLSEEVNKLVNYDANVTLEAVRELVTAGVEQSIFELVDAMTAGKTAAALGGYRKLLERRENELYILTMIQWQLRNLVWGVNAPEGITQAELAKAAGLSPYVAGKVLAARKRTPRGVVTAAYVASSEAEFDIKTGRAKAEVAVEQLIYRVCEAVNAKVSNAG